MAVTTCRQLGYDHRSRRVPLTNVVDIVSGKQNEAVQAPKAMSYVLNTAAREWVAAECAEAAADTVAL